MTLGHDMKHYRTIAVVVVLSIWTILVGACGHQKGEKDTTAPQVTITSPTHLSTMQQTPIVVTGEVAADATEVTVNGLPATFDNQTWTATVPLQEGSNTLTVVARDAAGNMGTTSIQVILDITVGKDPTTPQVTITAPTHLSTVHQTPIVVTGEVAADATEVTVNGVPATLQSQTWTATVPLQEGSNMLTVVSQDAAGNLIMVNPRLCRGTLKV